MDPDSQESQQWPPRRRRRHYRSGVNIGRSSVHWATESIPDDHVMGINCRTILELIHTEECPPALFSLNALQPISTLADDQCRYQGPRIAARRSVSLLLRITVGTRMRGHPAAAERVQENGPLLILCCVLWRMRWPASQDHPRSREKQNDANSDAKIFTEMR